MNKKEYNSEHNVYTTINIQDSTPALGHSILKISRAASDSIHPYTTCHKYQMQEAPQGTLGLHGNKFENLCSRL